MRSPINAPNFSCRSTCAYTLAKPALPLVAVVETCPDCGHRRCVDAWDNPCGHPDIYAECCSKSGCSTPPPGVCRWADAHYSYCSADCAGTQLLAVPRASGHRARQLCAAAREACHAAEQAWDQWDTLILNGGAS